MSDTNLDEVARNLRDAERATSAGDHREAERVLRQALKLQEAHFGLVHPEVANTLNVLGSVCCLLGRLDEAEFLHRRALGIARQTLGDNDPTVNASLRHLSKLYESQGKLDRLDKVAGDRSPTSASSDFDTASKTRAVSGNASAAAETLHSAPAAISDLLDRLRESQRAYPARFRQVALLVVVSVVVLVSILWFWGGNGEEGDEVVASSAVSAAAPTVDPVPASGDAEGGRPDVEAVPEATDEPAAIPEASMAPTRDASIVVSAAEVCSQLVTRSDDGTQLSAWRCDPVGAGEPTGLLFFYTRVQSPAGTTIEHRWYRDGALDQRVALDIAANDGPGYRTYSARIVSPQDGSSWRVEAWSAGEELLHAEDFVVR